MGLNRIGAEDLMTSGGLSEADRVAMNHQINAINAVEETILKKTPGGAAYYGSYILGEREKREIKEIFPNLARGFGIGEEIP